ncbi:MAG: MGMT family protein [Candidatus Marinimicrobia bacterium]|nr:MGMT family protein [Candidatus Neomarinimicrobiota bacterium]
MAAAQDHINNKQVAAIVKWTISNSEAIQLFQHWKECTDCQNRLIKYKSINPIYSNTVVPDNTKKRVQHFTYNQFKFDFSVSKFGVNKIDVSYPVGDANSLEHNTDNKPATELINFLKNYTDGHKTRFYNIDPSYIDTNFRREVLFWTSLIPYGETICYSKIGKWMNNKCAQAIGQALHKNPLPIIIPCHRVIGKDGSLTGFASGLKLKKKLLQMEQN